MPQISSHKHISPTSLPKLDQMTYRRATLRKVSVDPQLNFVNPIKSVRKDRNNLLSTQLVNIDDLSNTYQSSARPKMPNTTIVANGLETLQSNYNTPQISYTQFLQMNNTSSGNKSIHSAHVSVQNQSKVLRELRVLNDFLDTQEINFNEKLPTSVAQSDLHSQLVNSIEKSYRKVIAKVLKQFQQNSVMEDIIQLFKRAIKGLDSVSVQQRDFTAKVIEKIKDDCRKAWEAKQKVDADFEHFKNTETLEAYFAKFKINPTREFRLEIINNVNMWLNRSNEDAVDPDLQRDQEKHMSSGVDRVLEMLSQVAPFENPQVSNQLSLDQLDRDQEKFLKDQSDKIRKDALSVARVAENNTKKILQITGGKMPTKDNGTNTETWMKLTRDFMDRIQQLESQIKREKIAQQNSVVEAQRTIESLRKDLKTSEQFQTVIRQQFMDSESKTAHMKQLLENKLSQEANVDLERELADFNLKKKETQAKIDALKILTKKTDLQEAQLESVTSSVELKASVNQDLAVVEDVYEMPRQGIQDQRLSEQEIQDLVPVVKKLALVYQVFQANLQALKYKGFYENFEKIIHAYSQVTFFLDQILVLSQTKDQAMLKVLNFGCVGDSQALKKVVDRIFTKTKTNQVRGTNQNCENVIQLNQITSDAAQFVSFYYKEKNNKTPAIKQKLQLKLQQACRYNDQASQLFEKLPSEIGLESSRLLFHEARDCYKNLNNFFKEHLAYKEIAAEMAALVSLVDEFKTAVAQIGELIIACGDADAFTKQFKRLNSCIQQERERQSRALVEVVMDTPPQTSRKVDEPKSVAESVTPQEEANTILVLNGAEAKTDLVSIISKKEEGQDAKVEQKPAIRERKQSKKDEEVIGREDLDIQISDNLIKRLTDQFQDQDINVVGPIIRESVNKTIASLRDEKPGKQVKQKTVAAKPLKKESVHKKEVPIKEPAATLIKTMNSVSNKEPAKVKEKLSSEQSSALATPRVGKAQASDVEDPIVALARQEARIADAVSKALAEANRINKEEMNKLKGYDDKDNCKSCGKPRVNPKPEPQRQQSEIKQAKGKETKPAPAKKVEKHSGNDSPKTKSQGTQIGTNNKPVELVVKPPALMSVIASETEEPDNISFSTQLIVQSPDQKEFDKIQKEVNYASYVKKIDQPDNSPRRGEIYTQKSLYKPIQKSEIQIANIALKKNFLSTHSFASSIAQEEESSPLLPTLAGIESPFVQVTDENEETPYKTSFAVVPQVPKGHTLLLDQACQTENKKLLSDILAMINEAFFDNLEKMESVPHLELQMTIDSFNKTMPQVFNQISKQASTFLVTNSVKYLQPSASCLKLSKADQVQINKQRAPLVLQDFSRYGQHTLELNQEIKERITVKTIGHIGGGFLGHQKR